LNSVIATEVHRRFCLDLSKQFPDYSNELWGITASDSQHGYEVWGGPPLTGPIERHGGSLRHRRLAALHAQATLLVLRTIKNRYGAGTWSRYGLWTLSIH